MRTLGYFVDLQSRMPYAVENQLVVKDGKPFVPYTTPDRSEPRAYLLSHKKPGLVFMTPWAFEKRNNELCDGYIANSGAVITREQFEHFLECLPPAAWRNRGGWDSFRMVEGVTGDLYEFFAWSEALQIGARVTNRKSASDAELIAQFNTVAAWPRPNIVGELDRDELNLPSDAQFVIAGVDHKMYFNGAYKIKAGTLCYWGGFGGCYSWRVSNERDPRFFLQAKQFLRLV